MDGVRKHAFSRKFLFTISYLTVNLLLSGCEKFGEKTYNCNNSSVSVYKSDDAPINPHESFLTRGADHHFDRTLFSYPDGSLHKPKLISRDQAAPVHRMIGIPAPNEEVESDAICKTFGSGVVVIENP